MNGLTSGVCKGGGRAEEVFEGRLEGGEERKGQDIIPFTIGHHRGPSGQTLMDAFRTHAHEREGRDQPRSEWSRGSSESQQEIVRSRLLGVQKTSRPRQALTCPRRDWYRSTRASEPSLIEQDWVLA